MTRRQCAKCPWRVEVDPHDIPNGYSVDLHKGLHGTIAEPGDIGLGGGPLRIMACHESLPGAEIACVGWLVNQTGPGNNIALRLQVIGGWLDGDVETVGRQHPNLAATIPGGDDE